MNPTTRYLIQSAVPAIVLLAGAGFARADNVPASHCEIAISKVMTAPSSHGSGSIRVAVKTSFIGNGEQIRRVGFYVKEKGEDLGNDSRCPDQDPYATDWKIIDGQPGSKLGESVFDLPIRMGSVDSRCNGFHEVWTGAFFVETDKNTYWLNPDLDSRKYFVFDEDAYKLIEDKGGTYNFLATNRQDLSYYNPLGCQP